MASQYGFVNDTLEKLKAVRKDRKTCQPFLAGILSHHLVTSETLNMQREVVKFTTPLSFPGSDKGIGLKRHSLEGGNPFLSSQNTLNFTPPLIGDYLPQFLSQLISIKQISLNIPSKQTRANR
ncbi:MAG: hypothetical protein GX654_13915 [Desulfatiglans sp.]|nr:hypothetical protein [Desulfatiglans sp.]